jgi:tRNA pseudouridine38-40 synthase
MTLRNIQLTLSYDGTEYHGWQEQPGVATVQGELDRAISGLVGSDIATTGASRTDAGVHALGQSVYFELDSPVPTGNLRRAINDRLPGDIAVREVAEVEAGFNVIGGVRNKLYRYRIYTGRVRSVLDGRYCWHVPYVLDTDAMMRAASSFTGRRDFKSFASAADCRENSVRTIFRSEVKVDGPWVTYEVEGDGFLYNMVRNIVGTLVDVGCGRIEAEKIAEILEAKDRCEAGQIAPAKGLCLVWIEYA